MKIEEINDKTITDELPLNLTEQLEEVAKSTHINDTVFELLGITKDMLLAEMERLRKLAETPYLTRTDVERVFDRIADILNK